MRDGFGTWDNWGLILADLVYKSEQDSQSLTLQKWWLHLVFSMLWVVSGFPWSPTKTQSHGAMHFVPVERVLHLLLCTVTILNYDQLLHGNISRKAKASCSLFGLAFTLKCFQLLLLSVFVYFCCFSRKRKYPNSPREPLPKCPAQMALLVVLVKFLLPFFLFFLFKIHSQPYLEISNS